LERRPAAAGICSGGSVDWEAEEKNRREEDMSRKKITMRRE
jgi:hypothetical protein